MAEDAPDAHTDAVRGVDSSWFSERCGRPCLWSAPMVGQSEPAFRMLVRRYGATLCTTPMIDAGGFARSPAYREEFPFFPEDRPLVVQFGGSDLASLVAAAQLAEAHCDAVELNCGCPQQCARKGNYGAFLMEDPDHLEALVTALVGAVSIPVFVKIRVFTDVESTVALARRIEAAGASVLTVHGRTRHCGQGRHLGAKLADWTKIRAVKEALAIPVVSNGNIRHLDDVRACLVETGADGVMSGCGLLSDPTLFSSDPTPRSRRDVALEYLELAASFRATHQQVTKHLSTLLGNDLKRKTNADLQGTILGFRGTHAELGPLIIAVQELRRRVDGVLGLPPIVTPSLCPGEEYQNQYEENKPPSQEGSQSQSQEEQQQQKPAASSVAAFAPAPPPPPATDVPCGAALGV